MIYNEQLSATFRSIGYAIVVPEPTPESTPESTEVE